MNVMQAIVITTKTGFGVYVITSQYGQVTYTGFKSKAEAFAAKRKLEAFGPFFAAYYPGYPVE